MIVGARKRIQTWGGGWGGRAGALSLGFSGAPISPEPVHLLHVVQGDHAVSQDDVQQAVGAEQELPPEVLPVQLCHLHQHPHGPGVHLVGVFSG